MSKTAILEIDGKRYEFPVVKEAKKTNKPLILSYEI
jgi:hypothetical protein